MSKKSPVTTVLSENLFLTIQTLTEEGVQVTKDKMASSSSLVGGEKESCDQFDFSQVGGVSHEKTKEMRYKKRHLLDENEVALRSWQWKSMMEQWEGYESAVNPYG